MTDTIHNFGDMPIEEVLSEIASAGLQNQFSIHAEYNEETDHVLVTISLEPLLGIFDQIDGLSVVENSPGSLTIVLDAHDGEPPSIVSFLADLDDETPYGVPHERVVAEYLRYGWSKEKIETRIEDLRKRGEIYSPRDGYHRATVI